MSLVVTLIARSSRSLRSTSPDRSATRSPTATPRDAVVGDGIVDHHLTPEYQGKAGVLRWIEQSAPAFTDMHVDILRQTGDGPPVATMFRMRATHTGELVGIEATAVDVDGMSFDRVVDAKVEERWVILDWLAMMQQMQAGRG